jgi:hypothetical protein
LTGELGPEAVRWEGGHPVAVGDEELAQATRFLETSAGFWGLYSAGDGAVVVHPGGVIRGRPREVGERLRAIAGDDDRDPAEREAASSFLPLLGGDDPGRAAEVPRSQADTGGLPPTYRLSDPTNSPPHPLAPDTEAEPPR